MRRILVCLDPDVQPSVFDSVVAIDAGVDHLLRHGGVTPESVRDLVHGAMFTRGPQDLRNTALFIGGSDVAAAEVLLEQTIACFFGPMRVSVMLDPGGANTTAAAAVLAAAGHVSLPGTLVTVLAATGPVGRRVVRLLAREGARVRAASRKLDRAADVCETVRKAIPEAQVHPCQVAGAADVPPEMEGAEVLISAGAAGVQLVSTPQREQFRELRVAIDLNAVPPTGIAGIDLGDKSVARDGQICYGAIGIGATKMKIHKAAIRRLFAANDQILDAEEIYALGKTLG